MIRNRSACKICKCREKRWENNVTSFNNIFTTIIDIDLHHQYSSVSIALLVVEGVRLEQNSYRFRDVCKWFNRKLYPRVDRYYDGAPDNLDIDGDDEEVYISVEEFDIGYYSNFSEDSDSEVSEIEDGVSDIESERSDIEDEVSDIESERSDIEDEEFKEFKVDEKDYLTESESESEFIVKKKVVKKKAVIIDTDTENSSSDTEEEEEYISEEEEKRYFESSDNGSSSDSNDYYY